MNWGELEVFCICFKLLFIEFCVEPSAKCFCAKSHLVIIIPENRYYHAPQFTDEEVTTVGVASRTTKLVNGRAQIQTLLCTLIPLLQNT